MDWIKVHGIRIVIVIGVGLVVYLLLQHLIPRLIGHSVSTSMKGAPEIEIAKRKRTLVNVLRNTVGIVICIIVIFTIIAEIGINIAPALASLGVLGVAIGLGAQNLIKDVVSGLLILFENQYGIGDVIRVAGISGLVEEVNLRRTILRDLDGVVHYVPNGVITTASNFTREYSRVNLNISVGYGEDLDRVIEVINRVCRNMAAEDLWKDKIVKMPQVLRVDALGDSGIEIKILGDTMPLAQWEIMGELRKRIKTVFDKEGIEIPWPHVKVFFGDKSGQPMT